MRKLSIMLGAVLVLGACDNDLTGPPDLGALFDTGGILAWDVVGMSGPGRYLSGLGGLPDHLKLTEAQAAAIKAAVDAFMQATKADREALAAIHKAVAEAKKAGASREDIKKIMDQGEAARKRIEAAEQALQARIESILTAEQRAWLEAHRPKRCDPRAAPPLTAEQLTQIKALISDYEVKNKADLETVKAALEKARAAKHGGASREEVKAILAAVQPALQRLAAAQKALQEAIDALLTPEQRASGCYRGLPAHPGVVGKVGSR